MYLYFANICKSINICKVLTFANKAALLKPPIVLPLVSIIAAGSDVAKAYSASALCNLALVPENCTMLAEAGAAKVLIEYLSEAGDFQAAACLYNILGRELNGGHERDELDGLLKEKLMCKKVNGILKKKVEGKDWGDWTLQHVLWTLQNLSPYESAKLDIIAGVQACRHVCSVQSTRVWTCAAKLGF